MGTHRTCCTVKASIAGGIQSANTIMNSPFPFLVSCTKKTLPRAQTIAKFQIFISFDNNMVAEFAEIDVCFRYSTFFAKVKQLLTIWTFTLSARDMTQCRLWKTSSYILLLYLLWWISRVHFMCFFHILKRLCFSPNSPFGSFFMSILYLNSGWILRQDGTGKLLPVSHGAMSIRLFTMPKGNTTVSFGTTSS